jgi:hypothetical protein
MRAQMILQVCESLGLGGGHAGYLQDSRHEDRQPLRPSLIAALRHAASKMSEPKRRAFKAEMTLKYGGGSRGEPNPSLGGVRRATHGEPG